MKKVVLLFLVAAFTIMHCGQGGDDIDPITGGIEEGFADFPSTSLIGFWRAIGGDVMPGYFWIFKIDGDFYAGGLEGDGNIHVGYCEEFIVSGSTLEISDRDDFILLTYTLQDDQLTVVLGEGYIANFQRTQSYPYVLECE